jgi:hypothetical protein
MLSRIAQLRAIGVELLERAGQGALPLDQIITYALGDLSTEGTEGDLLALLAAACVGEFITVGQAQRLLEHSAPERLPAAIYSTLFADGDVETDELLETLYEAAVAMIADGEGFDDLEVDADTPRSTGEINANAETTGELSPTTSQDIDQGRESESVIVSAEAFLDEIVDSEGRFTLDDADEGTTDEIASDEIDWAQALDGVDASTLTPLRLVAIMRSMDDLALPKTPLASLALLDMTLTAISAAPKYPCELLEYIWPTHQTLLDDFGDHMVVVQLLAGVLLRFEMMCDAGLLMPDTNLLDQLFHIDTVSLLSDLFGAPDIVFWLERHVLGGTPEQLTARIHKVADVLDTVGVEIIPDVSTAYYLELIGENP